jgi:hypothetical protein
MPLFKYVVDSEGNRRLLLEAPDGYVLTGQGDGQDCEFESPGSSSCQVPTHESSYDHSLLHSVEAHKIGDVVLNIDGTNPATKYGYGTWVQIGQGKMLVGQNPSDPDFDTAEETGGSKTVDLSHQHNLQDHTHSYTDVLNHTHTVSITDPGHTHNQGIRNSGTAGTAGVQGASAANNATITNGVPSKVTGVTATTQNPSGGVASGTTSVPSDNNTNQKLSATQSIMNPYLVVYIFKRTA